MRHTRQGQASDGQSDTAGQEDDKVFDKDAEESPGRSMRAPVAALLALDGLKLGGIWRHRALDSTWRGSGTGKTQMIIKR